MVRKLSGAKTMRVEQHVVIEDSILSDNSIQFQETLRYFYPDHFRSDTVFEGTQRIFVISGGQQIVIIDGMLSNTAPSRFEHYKDPLLYHSRNMIHRVLLINHMDVGETSLGRFDDRLVYIIGAQYPNDTVSQLWVDKDRFLPLRWLSVNPGDETDRIEFRYRQWRMFGDVWYPMRIEIFDHDRLVRLIQTTDIQLDVDFSPELFDVIYLRSVYQPNAHPLETPSSKSEADDVRRAIEQFQKKFE